MLESHLLKRGGEGAFSRGRGEDSKIKLLRHFAQPEDRQPPVAGEVPHF